MSSSGEPGENHEVYTNYELGFSKRYLFGRLSNERAFVTPHFFKLCLSSELSNNIKINDPHDEIVEMEDAFAPPAVIWAPLWRNTGSSGIHLSHLDREFARNRTTDCVGAVRYFFKIEQFAKEVNLNRDRMMTLNHC